jgi:hypothetical protein
MSAIKPAVILAGVAVEFLPAGTAAVNVHDSSRRFYGGHFSIYGTAMSLPANEKQSTQRPMGLRGFLQL